MRKTKNICIILGILISILFLFNLYRILFQQYEPVGIDGYYYVIQVNNLLGFGELYYGSFHPLVFYLQAFFSYVLDDTVFGIKIFIALISISYLYVLFLTIFRLNKKCMNALLLTSIIVFAHPFQYFVAEYIKNFVGIIFLITSYFIHLRYIETLKSKYLLLSILMLILSSLSHIITFFFSVLLSIYFIIYFLSNKNLNMNNIISLNSVIIKSILVVYLTIFATSLSSELVNINIPIFRFSNHIENKISLILLPASMGIVSILMLFTFTKKNHKKLNEHTFTKEIFFFLCLFIIITTLFSYIDLSSYLNQLIDRINLALFLLFGLILSKYFISIQHEPNKILYGLIGLLIIPFYIYSKPDGLTLSEKYSSISIEKTELYSSLPKQYVIIAPHGIEFLLKSKYGLNSTHTYLVKRDCEKFLFLWKKNFIMDRLNGRRIPFLDLENSIIVNANLFIGIYKYSTDSTLGKRSVPKISSPIVIKKEKTLKTVEELKADYSYLFVTEMGDIYKESKFDPSLALQHFSKQPFDSINILAYESLIQALEAHTRDLSEEEMDILNSLENSNVNDFTYCDYNYALGFLALKKGLIEGVMQNNLPEKYRIIALNKLIKTPQFLLKIDLIDQLLNFVNTESGEITKIIKKFIGKHKKVINKLYQEEDKKKGNLRGTFSYEKYYGMLHFNVGKYHGIDKGIYIGSDDGKIWVAVEITELEKFSSIGEMYDINSYYREINELFYYTLFIERPHVLNLKPYKRQ